MLPPQTGSPLGCPEAVVPLRACLLMWAWQQGRDHSHPTGAAPCFFPALAHSFWPHPWELLSTPHWRMSKWAFQVWGAASWSLKPVFLSLHSLALFCFSHTWPHAHWGWDVRKWLVNRNFLLLRKMGHLTLKKKRIDFYFAYFSVGEWLSIEKV
jgi:hypothetical protein